MEHLAMLRHRASSAVVIVSAQRNSTYSRRVTCTVQTKNGKVRLITWSRNDIQTRICSTASTADYGQLTDIGVPTNSYIALGLAHCFEKNAEGKLVDRMVIEPIAANSLECMVLGAKTCFRAVTGLLVEDALTKDSRILPEEFWTASFCSDYEYRLGASARTWLRPHAQDNLFKSFNAKPNAASRLGRLTICRDLVPLGQTRTKFNFNLDEKRVLNFENEVSDDDNIKQDMSIDVYGRKEKEEQPNAGEIREKNAESSEKSDDQEMDSLLSM